MSEELLKLADDWLAPRGVPSTPYLLIRDLAARVRELDVERMTHGNVMGRIAAAVFGDQNNRTDEECVAAIAELGYGLTGARLRAERAEAERDALRAFARAMFDAADWPEGGDIDGFQFQEIAVEHGLLIAETRNEPCQPDGCHCSEYHGDMGDGVTCYRKVPFLLDAALAKGKGDADPS